MKSAGKMTGTVLAMAAIIAVVALLLFWRGGDKRTDNLIIISPHQEGIRVEFERAFSEWHRQKYGRAVAIDWIDVGGTTKDEQYVKASFLERPEGGDFDIFFGGGTDPYLGFVELGIASPFKLPEAQLSKLPKEIGGIPLYDQGFAHAKNSRMSERKNGGASPPPAPLWYGASLTAFGILYNKAVLKEEGLAAPAVWDDLADQRFFELVSLADPRYSGSMRMMFEIILQAYGWEEGFDLIIRMGANAPRFAYNSSQAAREVTLGEVACGLAIDFYAWAEIEEGGRENMGFVMPSGLTVMNPDCIAILKGAPHLELAKRFVTFVMSEEGQRLWILPVGSAGGPTDFALMRMAVLPSVYEKYKDETLVAGNPFEIKFFRMKYDREKGGARRELINALIGAMVIDTHEELKKAYKAVIDRGMPQKYVRMLTQLPVTEKEALEIAGTRWRDAGERARIMAEWTVFSRKKMAQIIKELR